LKLIPGGNWLRKARKFNIEDGMLKVELLDNNNELVESQIKIAPGFTVIEDDGELKLGPEEFNETPLLPSGDWIDTAKDCKYENGIL
jgi:hypothetical protein